MDEVALAMEQAVHRIPWGCGPTGFIHNPRGLEAVRAISTLRVGHSMKKQDDKPL
jgi:hypothetical protein